MAELKFQNDELVFNEVQKWLTQLYGDELCPNLHELDARDMKCLLTLKKQNEESEKNMKEEIKLKKNRICSLNSKTDDLKNLVASEEVCLREGSWKQVESIARLAEKMNLGELNLTNLLLGICHLKNENMKNEEHKIDNCALLSTYSQQNYKIKKSNDILESELDSLKEVVDIQESNKVRIVENINFFNTKSTEYESSVKLNKDRLKDVNFKKPLQHGELVEYSKTIKDLEQKLKVSIEKLKSYRNLPPNEKLTELKIQEKKEELMKLEQEYDFLVETYYRRNGIKK